MHSRLILEALRAERTRELEEFKIYGNLWHDDGKELIAHRKAILTLELPFKTDSVSLNESWVNTRKREKSKVENVFEKWFSSYRNFDQKDAKNSFRTTLKSALHEQVDICSNSFEVIFKDKVRELIVPAEDLNRVSVLQAFAELIERANFTEATKENYLLRLDAIFRPITYENNIVSRLYKQRQTRALLRSQPKLLGNKLNISPNKRRVFLETICPYELANFFDYLESRYLKSNKKEHLVDLVEIRFMFYAPLSCQELHRIKMENIGSNSLVCQETHFNFPESFMELASSVKASSDTLMTKNEKQLYKLILNLSNSCGLKKVITPTYIKKGLQAIYLFYAFSPERLPKR
jgi:hypothetical protein